MIPFLSLMLLTIYVLVDTVTSTKLYSFEVIAGLAFILFLESFRIVLSKRSCFKEEIWNEKGRKPGVVSNLVNTLISLILMQFGHFFGFLYQLVKSGLSSKKSW